MIDEMKSIREVEKTLEGKSDFFISTKEQLNKGIDHIHQLITHAYMLFENKAFSSSVFISIAVIEEVAKLHMGMYIRHSVSAVKKDKLRDHKIKEIIGTNYTVCMGERIRNTIETKKLEEIFEMSYSGNLKELREKSIYCECIDDELITPNNVVNKSMAKNILLFAIESFDDNLVGYTEHSMDVSKETDILFEKVASM